MRVSSEHPGPLLVREPPEELPLSSPRLLDLLQAVLDHGARVRFRAKGFSMSPFIRDGDFVTIAPLGSAAPRFGDVVVFFRPSARILVVHRIVGRRANAFLAKGDSNMEVDGWIPRANLLGRVVRVEREGKSPVFGLGPERFLVALLTRLGLLSRILQPARALLRTFRRNHKSPTE